MKEYWNRNTTNVECIVDQKVLYHGWLFYSYLQVEREGEGGGGGVTQRILYGEAPPRGSTPYPFIYHF